MMNAPVRNVNSGNSHDYNQNAELFATAASGEKTLLAGKLKDELLTLERRGKLRPKKHKIVDIGCGPFLLPLPLIRKGMHVDGVDPSSEMRDVCRQTISVAKSEIEKIRPNLLAPDKGIKIVANCDDLKSNAYQVAFLNFVHQCAENENSLVKLFENASRLLKSDGHLILMGAHPDYLHLKHSYCEYDITDSSNMSDGQAYTGRIFNDMGLSTYELNGDYFWSLDSIQRVATRTGFSMKGLNDIQDKDTLGRDADPTPAYFMMSLKLNS